MTKRRDQNQRDENKGRWGWVLGGRDAVGRGGTAGRDQEVCRQVRTDAQKQRAQTTKNKPEQLEKSRERVKGLGEPRRRAGAVCFPAR